MLAGTTIAVPSPCFALMASATSWQASALRLEITTFAPWSAIASAIARPMPRDEPVITATFPLRSNRLIRVSSGWAALSPSPRWGGVGEGCGSTQGGAGLEPHPHPASPIEGEESSVWFPPSSFEHHHRPRRFAGAELVDGAVDLAEADPLRHEAVEVEPAGEVEIDQPRDVEREAVRAHQAALHPL